MVHIVVPQGELEHTSRCVCGVTLSFYPSEVARINRKYRTEGYVMCPNGHEHVVAVVEADGSLRFLDENSGETR